MSIPHLSVLCQEVLHAFSPLSLTTVIDGTLGAGGHAHALLEAHPEIICYLGIDQDPHALALASKRLAPWQSKVCLKKGNFSEFDRLLQEEALPRPNAILLDLGVSSMQLDQPERGFSFMRSGPLDMRMDPTLPLTAADILNSWTEEELGYLFREYGEEKQWRLAARAIVRMREEYPFLTTSDLVERLSPVLARHAKRGIHPLTLIFQALRIAVNHELESLESGLSKSLEWLLPGGRLAVISFHSLEDRLVKTQMRLAASDKWDTSGVGGLFRDKVPTVRLVTKKPIEPTAQEIAINPRCRSAKLRVIEKICDP